jgi:hypothetical protein
MSCLWNLLIWKSQHLSVISSFVFFLALHIKVSRIQFYFSKLFEATILVFNDFEKWIFGPKLISITNASRCQSIRFPRRRKKLIFKLSYKTYRTKTKHFSLFDHLMKVLPNLGHNLIIARYKSNEVFCWNRNAML